MPISHTLYALILREEHILQTVKENIKNYKVNGKSGQFKVFYEEHCDLYRSPSIVQILKSMRLCWTAHVARTRKTSMAYTIFFENRHLENQACDWRKHSYGSDDNGRYNEQTQEYVQWWSFVTAV